jgi:hypothetical protein
MCYVYGIKLVLCHFCVNAIGHSVAVPFTSKAEKVFRYKRSSLFSIGIDDDEKEVITLTPGISFRDPSGLNLPFLFSIYKTFLRKNLCFDVFADHSQELPKEVANSKSEFLIRVSHK